MTDVIAEVFDYLDFQQALRDRAEQLKLSRGALDALAGLADGHSGKMLADPPSKNMGIRTFGRLMEVLGVKLLMVEDADQMARMNGRIVPRNEQQVRKRSMQSVAVHDEIVVRISRRNMRRIAAIGGKKSWARMSERQRTKHAKRLARSRWSNRSK